MALSKSTLQKGQIPIQCQLCEVNPNIKWKCLQCDLLMCNMCREKIHPKIKTAGEHKIIDIKDIGLHQEESGSKFDYNSIGCQKHDEQTCCLFCKTCDELICLDCVTKSHTKHDMVQIKEEYDRRKGELIQRQKKLQQEKQGLEQKHEKLNHVIKSEKNSHEKTKEEILEHEKTLQKQVHLNITKLLTELDQGMVSVQSSITQEQTKINKTITEMYDKVNKTEIIINSTDVSKFFREYSFLCHTMKVQIPPLNLNPATLPTFTPGQITQVNIGSLGHSTDTEKKFSEINLKKEKEFITNLSSVGRIYSSPDNSLWIKSNADSQLQNVIIDRTNLKTISSYNVKVYDIVITTEGDVLLSTNKSTLQQLDIQTGKLRDTKYGVYPLETTAIHITTDNKIIVGAGSPGRVVVMVMDMAGRYEMTYEHDKENKALFTLPCTITSDKNGNIWVVDTVPGEYRGKVVVLSQNGGVLYYIGHSDTCINTKDKPFNPTSIVMTSLDNAVVTDCSNSVLHILNQSARLIKYINLTDIGIELPYSLLYKHPRQLYIGCATTTGSKEKAKLYQVELSGC